MKLFVICCNLCICLNSYLKNLIIILFNYCIKNLGHNGVSNIYFLYRVSFSVLTQGGISTPGRYTYKQIKASIDICNERDLEYIKP